MPTSRSFHCRSYINARPVFTDLKILRSFDSQQFLLVYSWPIAVLSWHSAPTQAHPFVSISHAIGFFAPSTREEQEPMALRDLQRLTAHPILFNPAYYDTLHVFPRRHGRRWQNWCQLIAVRKEFDRIFFTNAPNYIPSCCAVSPRQPNSQPQSSERWPQYFKQSWQSE